MTARREHRRQASRLWRGASLGALLAGVAVAGCGGGSGGKKTSSATTGAPPTTTRPSTAPSSAAADLVATLRAPGHHPKVNGHWPITVHLTWRGTPTRGHVSYEFLLGSQVVSRQQVGGKSPDFTGSFTDDITWPASSVGYQLTFRVVVTSPHGTKNLDYPVQVER
jgi:hypothetical protein